MLCYNFHKKGLLMVKKIWFTVVVCLATPTLSIASSFDHLLSVIEGSKDRFTPLCGDQPKPSRPEDIATVDNLYTLMARAKIDAKALTHVANLVANNPKIALGNMASEKADDVAEDIANLGIALHSVAEKSNDQNITQLSKNANTSALMIAKIYSEIGTLESIQSQDIPCIDVFKGLDSDLLSLVEHITFTKEAK